MHNAKRIISSCIKKKEYTKGTLRDCWKDALLRRCRGTQRKLWHSTTGHYYILLLSCPSAHLYTRSLSHFLPLPRSFLASRARFSSSSLSFFGPRELSRRVSPPPRRWNRIVFFLLQRRRRHSKTRTRRCIRAGRKRKKEGEKREKDRKERRKERTHRELALIRLHSRDRL